MAKIADVIKYEGDNSTFIWKHPLEDFNSLTQLIVHENQEAVFFMNGQALDLFGPGRYTLESQNIPLLGKLISKITGGDTPFHCEVYFINKSVQMALKWGTDTRVRFLEPTYGIPLEIGASGEMNLMVSDSRKLLVKLIGTMNGIAWENKERVEKDKVDGDHSNFTKSIKDAFRPLISTAVKSKLSQVIGANNIDILEIDKHLNTLSEVLGKSIRPGFEEYGLTIPEFYVTTVNLPPNNDENYKNLIKLHSIALQTKMVQAEATVKTAMAEAKATVTAAERQAVIEEEITKTEQKRRAAERDVIDAQVEAEKIKVTGKAEAEVMKEKGYDYKDVLEADVQKAKWEGIGNMNISGGGAGVAGDMIGLGVGMAAAGMVAPQMGEMFKGFSAGQTVNNESVSGTQAETVVCPNCNSEVSKGAKFCHECGTKIEVLAENERICPTCGCKTVKGKFCMECGAALVKKCAKCGTEIPDGAKFCLECGEKLN